MTTIMKFEDVAAVITWLYVLFDEDYARGEISVTDHNGVFIVVGNSELVVQLTREETRKLFPLDKTSWDKLPRLTEAQQRDVKRFIKNPKRLKAVLESAKEFLAKAKDVRRATRSVIYTLWEGEYETLLSLLKLEDNERERKRLKRHLKYLKNDEARQRKTRLEQQRLQQSGAVQVSATLSPTDGSDLNTGKRTNTGKRKLSRPQPSPVKRHCP